MPRARAFVQATVVRAQVPSSARAGDAAIVLEDGSIEGFVGGQCAESSVRSAALNALASGESMLLRVLPVGGPDFPDSPGAQVVVNPCLSGGALEIFLEPMLPPPLVRIVGETPVAEALVALCEVLGYTTARWRSGEPIARTDAVVIAGHGRDEGEPHPRGARCRGAVRGVGREPAPRCGRARRTRPRRRRAGADQYTGRPRHRRAHRAGGGVVDPRRGDHCGAPGDTGRRARAGALGAGAGHRPDLRHDRGRDLADPAADRRR